MNAELVRALAVLAEPPTSESARLWRLLDLGDPPSPAEYADLFLFNAYPYASVYLDAEGMLGGEARDRVAGFWRAMGERPPAEPDHLAFLLGQYARLSEEHDREVRADRRAALDRAGAALLTEHILPWVPVFAATVERIVHGSYRAWARLLLEGLRTEAGRQPWLPTRPLHLERAPTASGPVEDLRALVSLLLAPVRSGMMITRADLARAARELELPLRAGERRFVLTTLLDIEPRRVIAWLTRETAWWADRHAGTEPWLGAVATFWRERALASRTALNRLLEEESIYAGHAGEPSH